MEKPDHVKHVELVAKQIEDAAYKKGFDAGVRAAQGPSPAEKIAVKAEELVKELVEFAGSISFGAKDLPAMQTEIDRGINQIDETAARLANEHKS